MTEYERTKARKAVFGLSIAIILFIFIVMTFALASGGFNCWTI